MSNGLQLVIEPSIVHYCEGVYCFSQVGFLAEGAGALPGRLS
jgi:hypothetical protein